MDLEAAIINVSGLMISIHGRDISEVTQIYSTHSIENNSGVRTEKGHGSQHEIRRCRLASSEQSARCLGACGKAFAPHLTRTPLTRTARSASHSGSRRSS